MNALKTFLGNYNSKAEEQGRTLSRAGLAFEEKIHQCQTWQQLIGNLMTYVLYEAPRTVCLPMLNSSHPLLATPPPQSSVQAIVPDLGLSHQSTINAHR